MRIEEPRVFKGLLCAGGFCVCLWGAGFLLVWLVLRVFL